jgi:hypothetical protein
VARLPEAEQYIEEELALLVVADVVADTWAVHRGAPFLCSPPGVNELGLIRTCTRTKARC